MRTLLMSFAVLFATSCCAPPPMEMEIVPPEVWLLVNSSNMRGSAVPFYQDGDKLWLLTVGHNLPMDTANGYPIEYQESHPTEDLAMVMVRVGELRFLNLPTIDFPPGFNEPVSLIGWHAGNYLSMTDGYIGIATDGDNLMSCPMAPGCSGGAVIDENGRLIGLGRAILKGPEHTSMGDWVMVPYPHISFYQPLAPFTGWIAGVISAN